MSESIYQIISRKEAKEQGLKFYFTGNMCKRGHLSEKRVGDCRCIECQRERKRSDERKALDEEYNKLYRKSNKSKEYDREYRKTDKCKKSDRDYQRGYQRNRRATDQLYRMKGDIRNLIKDSTKKGGFKKSSRTAQILGCSFEEFKIHIENQFTEGMNRENHGEWHYDHIYPIAKSRD